MRETADPARESQASAIGEAPNAGGFWRAWARNLAIGAAAGLFLALVGAAGTADASMPRRLLYWIPLMMLGVLLGGAVASGVGRLLPARPNVWLLGVLTTLGVCLVSGGLIVFYSRLFWGPNLVGGDWFGFLAVLLAISAAMTAIMIAVNQPGAVTHASPASESTPARARFLDRLPPKLKGAALYAIQAEDHYLRLHTSKGSDLILMRLSDAITELDGLEGAQTHRSWWVARDAVEGALREGDRVSLKLKGGASAPVSRPNVRPLREAGWL